MTQSPTQLRFLTREAKIPKTVQLPITREEFGALRDAHKSLVHISEFETRFDQLVESHIELKEYFYLSSIRNVSVSTFEGPMDTYNRMNKLNRLLFNTLNLGKFYLDKHFHNHKKTDETSFIYRLTSSKELHESVRDYRDEVFHENIEYQLACKLRGTNQHHSLPVKSLTSGYSRQPGSKNLTSVIYTSVNSEILNKIGISSNLLQHFGESVDLHSVIDGYVYAIAKQHCHSRELLQYLQKSSLELLNKKMTDLRTKYSNIIGAFEVVDYDREQLFHLDTDWTIVIKELQKKNSRPVDYSKIEFETYKK